MLDRRADRRQVERLELVEVGDRIAHCGLPIVTCWKRGPATSPVPSAPAGKCSERSRARPMSTRQVVGPRIVGRISPAAVWIENWSWSVQPARRRYRIASRAPLPDSSASEPSGLKIRSRATKPGASGGESSSTPSAPGPAWRSHSRRTARRSAGTRSRPPPRSGSRCRAPATSRTASAASMPAARASVGGLRRRPTRLGVRSVRRSRTRPAACAAT